MKISDNEVEFITGRTDFDTGAAILYERFPNLRLLCLTAGPDGSYAYYKGRKVWRPGCKLGGTIETTGAGDTFCACMLNLVTTKKGALRVMPDRAQVEEVLTKM